MELDNVTEVEFYFHILGYQHHIVLPRRS